MHLSYARAIELLSGLAPERVHMGLAVVSAACCPLGRVHRVLVGALKTEA